MYIFLIIVGVLVLSFFLMYNGLVAKKNQVHNSFATIDVF